MPSVTSVRCSVLGLASDVAQKMVREGTPSTENIVMLALLLAAAVTDLMLAIVFVFILLLANPSSGCTS